MKTSRWLSASHGWTTYYNVYIYSGAISFFFSFLNLIALHNFISFPPLINSYSLYTGTVYLARYRPSDALDLVSIGRDFPPPEIVDL